jgi:hypothetical protein
MHNGKRKTNTTIRDAKNEVATNVILPKKSKDLCATLPEQLPVRRAPGGAMCCVRQTLELLSKAIATTGRPTK